ncbi:hypothetical protein N7532_000872 [Penicillium argentinense]|uniref:Rhomboid family membrane protein n=1 Tax=Penicillium argentinense TaxID=1131581 RepID=A0A9W9G6C5_9EURO|nr:uncharacterized protein N7532_000872 [Penicillium argentinense]KAJ5112827.1 hypothetical protein N7532_000872 [Penicillium argentinense]
MASPDPQMDTHAQRQADYERFKNYAAMTFLVASPVLIALPPRKFDYLTVMHASAFCISANYITRERTGRSIVERLASRLPTRKPGVLRDLPSDRAEEIQARLRAAREAQIKEAVGEELEKLKARQAQDQGIAERVWMGGESPGWMERRLQEEQKALEEGKGYGDLIQEHIWDVWNWGKKKDEDEEDD